MKRNVFCVLSLLFVMILTLNACASQDAFTFSPTQNLQEGLLLVSEGDEVGQFNSPYNYDWKYELERGEGDKDNNLFKIIDYNRLIARKTLTAGVYHIRVNMTRVKQNEGGIPLSFSFTVIPAEALPIEPPIVVVAKSSNVVTSPNVAIQSDIASEQEVQAIDTTITPIHWSVNNMATWIQAVNGIRNSGNNKNHIITVNGSFSVPTTPASDNTFGSVTNIHITMEGSGTISLSSNGSLLRIGENQTVTIEDITLQGRENNNGSVVITAGEFTMAGSATVTGNQKAGGSGGGIHVTGGTFTMKDNAMVSNNSIGYSGFQEGGGGVCINKGTFIMQDSSVVSGNTDGDKEGYGGVFVRKGIFIMKDTASVKDNTGCGVGVDAGTFTMQNRTTIQNNTGRGISIVVEENGATGIVIMQDSSVISGNSEGGVNMYAILRKANFTMQDNASLTGNSSSQGGGLSIGSSGTAIIKGNARITDNKVIATDDDYSVYVRGGGVYIDDGTLILSDNASISNNSVSANFLRGINYRGNDGYAYAYGGGVYISRGSFNMSGGTVSGNTAGENGGGVYIKGGLNKTGGTIYGNDAESEEDRNTASNNGDAIYWTSGPQWRGVTVNPTDNPNDYGFWLND
ncbi:MAG: hypothetical protein LBV43_06460 [Prevotella sp.]|jgi:hypothetical protein|nr:hypothetical protein [Prevotella sp.]